MILYMIAHGKFITSRFYMIIQNNGCIDNLLISVRYFIIILVYCSEIESRYPCLTFNFKLFFFKNCRYDWSYLPLGINCRESRFRLVDGMDLYVCFTISSEAVSKQKVSALSSILYLHDFNNNQIPYYAPLHYPNIFALYIFRKDYPYV